MRKLAVVVLSVLLVVCAGAAVLAHLSEAVLGFSEDEWGIGAAFTLLAWLAVMAPAIEHGFQKSHAPGAAFSSWGVEALRELIMDLASINGTLTTAVTRSAREVEQLSEQAQQQARELVAMTRERDDLRREVHNLRLCGATPPPELPAELRTRARLRRAMTANSREADLRLALASVVEKTLEVETLLRAMETPEALKRLAELRELAHHGLPNELTPAQVERARRGLEDLFLRMGCDDDWSSEDWPDGWDFGEDLEAIRLGMLALGVDPGPDEDFPAEGTPGPFIRDTRRAAAPVDGTGQITVFFNIGSQEVPVVAHPSCPLHQVAAVALRETVHRDRNVLDFIASRAGGHPVPTAASLADLEFTHGARILLTDSVMFSPDGRTPDSDPVAPCCGTCQKRVDRVEPEANGSGFLWRAQPCGHLSAQPNLIPQGMLAAVQG